MSNRSLIEINHDFADALGPAFVEALVRYLASASRENATVLEQFGVKVVGMRHHSSRFVLDGTPDGFPAMHLLPASKP